MSHGNVAKFRNRRNRFHRAQFESIRAVSGEQKIRFFAARRQCRSDPRIAACAFRALDYSRPRSSAGLPRVARGRMDSGALDRAEETQALATRIEHASERRQ
jgi:hypothetical protein